MCKGGEKPLLFPSSLSSQRDRTGGWGVSQPVREGTGAAVISATARPGGPRCVCVCETAVTHTQKHLELRGRETKQTRVHEPHNAAFAVSELCS